MKPQHLSYADWSGQEYAAIARSVFTGRIRNGAHPATLAATLSQMYAPSTVYLVNYGHHAITMALTMFKALRPGCDEVIVPAYICPSVVAAVQACGLKAVSADVQADLNLCPTAMQAAITPRTLAVIAAHMFGCPARIHDMEAICERAQVFLIDDAAQVVGVRAGGRLLGTFGDAGVISFAQSKAIVTGIRGSGGVLLVNKPTLAAAAKAAWQVLPEAGGRLGALLDFLWNYVWAAHTGHTGYYLARLLSAVREPVVKPDHATRISNLEAGIALVQLTRLSRMIENKVSITAIFHKGLRPFQSITFPQYQVDRFLARVMLLVPAGLNMAHLRRVLKSRGIETRVGYAAYLSAGANVPNAEKMAQHLVGVPYRANMTQADVEAVCHVLGTTIADMQRDQP